VWGWVCVQVSATCCILCSQSISRCLQAVRRDTQPRKPEVRATDRPSEHSDVHTVAWKCQGLQYQWQCGDGRRGQQELTSKQAEVGSQEDTCGPFGSTCQVTGQSAPGFCLAVLVQETTCEAQPKQPNPSWFSLAAIKPPPDSTAREK
jgi:hypothetical protein